jgi:pimeloyl-ACP methyl ester carboxylesterase
MQHATKYAKSGDVSIGYQVFGNGPIDLVLVPGWVSNIDSYWEEPTIARFLDGLGRFARVIHFDKRGTGVSDRVADMPDFETRMDDVRAVMNAAGSESAVLLGTSEGGPMCALFAATYPARTMALILHGSFARMEFAPDYPLGRSPEASRMAFEYVERNWGTAIGIEQRAPSMATDERFRDWWARSLRSSASPSAALTLMRMNAQIDIRAVLPAIRVPTLLLHSTNDQVFSIEASRYMAARIPGAKLIELHGLDHIPTGDDGGEILQAIEEFVTGRPSETHNGTVLATLMFTDIVGSTEMATAFGDRRWVDLLERHHAIVRRELAHFRGTEIDNAGDGFLASFDGPARAVRCACAIAEAVKSIGLQNRAGVHTGECEFIGSKLGGVTVHIGARIAAQAAPGEVLVSRTVKDLVAGSSLQFEPRGIKVLKGLPGEWGIFAVAPISSGR